MCALVYENQLGSKKSVISLFTCFEIQLFLGSDKPRMLFFLFINVYQQEKFHAQVS